MSDCVLPETDDAAIAALCTQAGAAASFAWLLVVFLATHFFLDSTAFNQLAESADGLLCGFVVS